jgi:hypothetical protein
MSTPRKLSRVNNRVCNLAVALRKQQAQLKKELGR